MRVFVPDHIMPMPVRRLWAGIHHKREDWLDSTSAAAEYISLVARVVIAVSIHFAATRGYMLGAVVGASLSAWASMMAGGGYMMRFGVSTLMGVGRHWTLEAAKSAGIGCAALYVGWQIIDDPAGLLSVHLWKWPHALASKLGY